MKFSDLTPERKAKIQEIRERRKMTWGQKLEYYKNKGFKTDKRGVTIEGVRYYSMI